MDRFRRRSTAEESFGRLERRLSGLTIARKGSVAYGPTETDEDLLVEDEDTKGPLGLNLLHTVPEPHIDFIFIHGLGGGSRKTWSKTTNPYHFWPKEWLSRDPEFGHVRVHSFGYKADWAEKKSNHLNVHDFSLSLLGEIQCSPEIRRSNTKIVLVAHSMGGIVTKKVSFGHKPFVAELGRDSDSVQSINDSFRYFADDLQLWSFYETVPYNFVLTNAMIVDKSSATLGLSKERCSLLNADHSGICKFESPTDPNYKSLRNAFITTVDSILTEVAQVACETTKSESSRLAELTGIAEPPIDDLFSLEEIRIPGTCEWLSTKAGYKTWKSAWSLSRPIFWLTGNAGTGKSVLSSYVINDLEESNVQCSYFFFKQGNASKSSISECLLSLAFQMGQTDESILKRLTQLSEGSDTWEQLDEKTLWRKVFQGGIFKEPDPEPRFWVIDALEECSRFPVLVSLFARAPPYLRVFLTSRHIPEVYQCITSHNVAIEHYSVQEQDTLADLGIFIDSRNDSLPAGNNGSHKNLRDKILEKANGSFLWTSLVVQELEGVYSEEAAEEVLNEVPADMNNLYARMLDNIPRKGHKLARSIFVWTLLGMRPLSLSELSYAVKLDTNETVHNLAKAIMAICGQLVGVSQKGWVQCIHQTARAFLLQQEQVPALAISKPKSHARIAELCLTALNMSFSPGARRRKSKTVKASADPVADITDYAAMHFSDHLRKSSSEDPRSWALLAEFFDSNVLMWVEYLAETGRLQHITSTAKNLKSYLMRRLKHMQPFSNEKESLEVWIHDLIRLNAKFRTALAICPSAIHNIIPALCPSESMVSAIHATRPRGITIKGPVERTWDECIATIDYKSVQTSAVAHGDCYSAVGASNGAIFIYVRDSTETTATLLHGERVRLLVFSDDDAYLASSGPRKVTVWDLRTNKQLWIFDVQHQPLTLAFGENSTILAAATQGNYTITWDLQEEQSEGETWSWTRSFHETTGQARPTQPPGKALFSDDCSMFAVSYRGRPVYLFDVKSETLVGSCSRNTGAVAGRQYVVDALAFNPNREISALVVSYGDGALVVYDIWSTEPRYQTADVFAHTLACSPDGRTLVTGSSRGTIQIFEFSGAQGTSLTLVYRINAFEEGIRGIAFSSDSLRFTDIRGSQYRIWEPAVLVGNDYDEGSQSELSQAVTLKPKSVGMLEGPPDAEITTMCTDTSGRYLLYGKEDGVVAYLNIQEATHREVLCRHVLNVRVTCIAYCDQLGVLATADESSRIIVSTVKITATGIEALSVVCDMRSDQPVLALLLDPSGTKLLVQGRHLTRIWTVLGTKPDTEITLHDLDGGYRVTNHHSSPNHFIATSAQSTKIFAWTNIMEPSGEAAGGNEPPNGSASNETADTNQSGQSLHVQFIASLCNLPASSEDTYKSRLMVWDTAQISTDGDWPSELHLSGFERISSRITQVIGVTGSLVLFLDSDLWVCSVDVRQWNAAGQGAWRHFFLLPEWKGNNREFLVEYIPRRR
ncbi:hypothetical protein AtubIFM61612_000215 [Aspergillus tubingensis]|nr:hypothetical protein AtubIFM61612_000215 [Aspergillus tubingensis]